MHKRRLSMPLDNAINAHLGETNTEGEEEEVITAAPNAKEGGGGNNLVQLPNLSITGKGASAAQYSSALGAYHDKHNGGGATQFNVDSSQTTSTR